MVERQESGKTFTDGAHAAGLAALHADPEWHKPDSGGFLWRANYARAVDLVLEAALPHLTPTRDQIAAAAHKFYCVVPDEPTHYPDDVDYDKADEILEILALVTSTEGES